MIGSSSYIDVKLTIRIKKSCFAQDGARTHDPQIKMPGWQFTLGKSFAQRGARTHDPQIKSLMLYRLS